MLDRHSTIAVVALVLIGAYFSMLAAGDARAQEPSASCEEAPGIAVLPSPVAPWKGAPLRVIFAAEKPLEGELSLIAPDGSVAAKSRERHGGPPYFWFAEVASPAAGTWRATLARDGAPAECGTITRDIAVRADRPPPAAREAGSVWPLAQHLEPRRPKTCISAWIEKLFDAPLDAALSWPALHEVLRDRSRNVLFNHLGLGEDEMKMVIRPDCADLPYFLRAYFAFKMGLPFGYSKCTRGGGGRAPRCTQWWSIQNRGAAARCRRNRTIAPRGAVRPRCFGMFAAPRRAPVRPRPPAPKLPQRPPGLAPAFGAYLRRPSPTASIPDRADGRERQQHRLLSGAAEQETLRPGTVYADPYGHILMIVRRVRADATARPASSSRSTGSPTARSRASASGAAISCSRRIPRSAAPGSSASGRSCARRTARLRRLTNDEIAKNSAVRRFLARSVAARASRTSTIAWTT